VAVNSVRLNFIQNSCLTLSAVRNAVPAYQMHHFKLFCCVTWRISHTRHHCALAARGFLASVGIDHFGAFLSLPFSSPSHPFPLEVGPLELGPLELGPLIPAKRFRKLYKLPQWGLERSNPSRQRFWCILRKYRNATGDI